MRCGDTFLMPAPGGSAVPHLWIVITEPTGNPPVVIIVNITTLQQGAEQTVILQRVDHPFIRHESVVR